MNKKAIVSNNKKLRTIFNNDINNILYALDGKNAKPEEYLRAVDAILDSKPGILAQNVGIPSSVIYESRIATPLHKNLMEVYKLSWPNGDPKQAQRVKDVLEKLFKIGKDPLKLTIEACQRTGTLAVASYRMNAEDWYDYTWMLSDFEREHPEWRIPVEGQEGKFAGCLDPAIPEVYEHRMKIFREVAEKYDIDGIEFDFRRWRRMISNPLKNYPILTRMVRETRMMLEEVAASKGLSKLILGVRVGASLDTKFSEEIFKGASGPNDAESCKELGLDVRTWIEEELVDYVCPSLFWPRWPGLPLTEEFSRLVRSKNIGIYPTLFPLPGWLEKEGYYKGPIKFDQKDKIKRYKNEFCQHALKLYEDGADGISTFNWYFHLRKANVPNLWCEHYGYGPAGDEMQAYILSILGNSDDIRKYTEQSEALISK